MYIFLLSNFVFLFTLTGYIGNLVTFLQEFIKQHKVMLKTDKYSTYMYSVHC